MIDYSQAYSEVKASSFQESNITYDLREPGGFQTTLASRRQYYYITLVKEIVYALRFGWTSREVLDIFDISERVFNNIYSTIKYEL